MENQDAIQAHLDEEKREAKRKEPKKNWICPKCNTLGTRLQQVLYGHVENGKFVVDEKTGLQCVYCHAVYAENDIKA